MGAEKIAITLDEKLVRKLDLLVSEKKYPNRSKAIQEAVEEKLLRFERGLLVRECEKLDPAHERALAEEGMSTEVVEWPEY